MVMHRMWTQCIELLWPEHTIPQKSIPTVSVTRIEGITYLHPYHTVSHLIRANKYQSSKVAAQLLAQSVDQYLNTIKSPFIIVPVPVSYKRWRTRGRNHITEILKYSSFYAQCNSTILTKIIDTPQQTQVSRAVRLQQQASTFAVKQPIRTPFPPLVLLLDDVMTTGATLRAARSELIQSLPSESQIICVAIAH